MDMYLLRHGETDWNKRGLLQGHTDIALNEHGKSQVRDTVIKLRDLGIRVDAIVSSPLQRARESAEIAAVLLDYPKERIVVEEMLTERGFGEGEGLSIEERMARYPECDYPGMESQSELVNRAGRAFQKITGDFKNADRILLTAHGAVLFALLEAVSEEPIRYEGRAACISQGSIYRIRHENGKNSLAVFDEEQSAFTETDAERLGRLAKIYM